MKTFELKSPFLRHPLLIQTTKGVHAAPHTTNLRYKLLIISDEIYGTMTFTGYEFTPIAALTTTVPVLGEF